MTYELPELSAIRAIVEAELPMGHRLDDVALTVDTLYEGQEPAFTVVISLTEEPDADLGAGMAYEITKKIRERWSRDDLYVRFQSKIRSE